MRWRYLLAVLLGLSIADEASLAQGPPGAQGSQSTSSSVRPDGYFASTGLVRFQLIGGRLCLDPPRHRKGSQSRDADGIYESISVTAERGIPSLHYVCHTDVQQLTLSVSDATELRLESWIPARDERAVLEQPEYEPAQLTVTRGEESQSVQGATLLHLRAGMDEAFDRHFALITTTLMRGRTLASISAQTQAELLAQLVSVNSPDRETVINTVAQLAAPKRADRVAAERRLAAWGTLVLPIVATIEPADLDAEQLSRLSRIRRRMRSPQDDTPAALAMRLLNDKPHWRLLAPQLSAAELELANRHFNRIGIAELELAAASPDSARLASTTASPD